MLNEIVKGISMKLNATFGDEYRAYQNEVQENMKEPCFFIAILAPSVSPLIGLRWLMRNPFDIHYFPKNPQNNAEMFTVAEQMMDCLQFITLPDGDQLHGTNINFEIVDGVLHFFVNYNLTLRKPVDPDYMETLSVKAGTTRKEG